MGIWAEQIKKCFNSDNTEFRESYRKEDTDQARIVITIVSVTVAAFIYVDYLYFKLSGFFFEALIARGVFCAISLAVVMGMKTYKKLKHNEYAILSWTSALAILTFGFNLTQPMNFYDSILLNGLMILGSYTLIPNRILFKAIPALMLTLGDLAILIFYRTELSAPGLIINIVTFMMINVLGLATSLRVEYYRRMGYEVKILENSNRLQMLELVTTDELTRIFNRRHFLELGEIEFDRYKRFGRIFSFVVLDIDKFKAINDTYGHPVGDMFLQRFCSILSAEKRSFDIVGRLGGDEFGVILPETSARDARKAIQRIKRVCLKALIPVSGQDLHITFSAGVTETSPADQSIDDLYRRADIRLYRKKQRLPK